MNRFFNWSWTRKLKWKKSENVDEEEEKEGPINRLPNELLQMILAKLEFDCDVRKLIQLRLVSTRWRAAVEDYCGQKKSLIVVLEETVPGTCDKRYLDKYFGFRIVISKDFACLYLSTKTHRKRLKSLLDIFPNIVELIINCEDRTRTRDLIDYINSLTSLKQLELVGPFLSALPSYLPLLSKLESYSHFWHNQLISSLGQSNCCVRFGGGITYDQHICQWHNINPNWLAINLTHLELYFGNNRLENAQVVHYLSEHATSLKLLKIYFLSTIVGLALSPTAIRDLGKLVHLTELELRNIRIDIPELEQEFLERNRLISLSTVTCKFNGTVFSSIDGPWISADRFTRVISIITPNLVELGIGGRDMRPQIDGHFRAEMEQYLYRLPNLHKKIVYY